jgi:hypothetical protein
MDASKTIPRIFSPPPSSHLAPRRPISFFLHRPLHFETYTAILSNQALQVQSARETGSRLRAWNCGSPQPGKPFQKRRQHGNKERNRLRLAKIMQILLLPGTLFYCTFIFVWLITHMLKGLQRASSRCYC